MKYFTWKPEKNARLKRSRGISFDEIAEAIDQGGFRGAFEYSGRRKVHQGQVVWLIEAKGRRWVMPVTISGPFVVARTVFEEGT